MQLWAVSSYVLRLLWIPSIKRNLSHLGGLSMRTPKHYFTTISFAIWTDPAVSFNDSELIELVRKALDCKPWKDVEGESLPHGMVVEDCGVDRSRAGQRKYVVEALLDNLWIGKIRAYSKFAFDVDRRFRKQPLPYGCIKPVASWIDFSLQMGEDN
ncbi:MAG: hypothetical protein Q8Q10_02300 [bacterium]|nr:hypothetical protein [bacterium]